MISFDHPYDLPAGGRWRRGNLHAHSTQSDGEREPQAVIDDYAARGYGYLMLSDHDTFTDQSFLAACDAKGLILLPGNEITARGPHMLQIGGDALVEPTTDRQVAIDQANAMDAMIVVNHPNWFARFNHCSQERMAAWQGYVGLEIYNGVIGRLDGSQYALDHWDMLLQKGRCVWGFANDDSHKPGGDMELGWNTTWVHGDSPEAVMTALREGRFYPSTGVVISSIEVEGNRISVQTENAERIVALRDSGRRLAVVDDSRIEFELTDEDATYIRFECWGKGESFAWTQPFMVQVSE
ncbi:MAG: PHP domain-containing protein [Lentisphaerae bacterium]|nr:PHP domain-containing protein [Lentisphaerota bacterium]